MKSRTILHWLIGVLSLLLLAPPSGSADVQKIYWTSAGYRPSSGKVQRANSDGTALEDVITGLSFPEGIAVDATNGKIYWTEEGSSTIQRANLNGGGRQVLVTGASAPEGIALDIAGGKMYWTEAGGPKRIRRANLDGTNIQDLVTLVYGMAFGIALDPIHDPLYGKMYWVADGSARIQRAYLDGSDIETLVTGSGVESQPEGIALDRNGGKIYWTEEVTAKIRRANLDGSAPQDLVTRGSPEGIALDLASGKMYWTDDEAGKILRANLDGSNVEELIKGLADPGGIALVYGPPPPGPKLYGLFVGQDFLFDNLRADLNATEIYQNFSNLSNVVYKKLLTDKVLPITDSNIESEIANICKVIQPGDHFFLYIGGHGGSSISEWDETTLTVGDEYIILSDLAVADWFFLTDDELTSYLKCMDGSVNKWIVLDGCHSGGFWGNNNPNDEGDLEKLSNISMIAAAAEKMPAHFIEKPTHPDFGKLIFGCAIRDCLQKCADGFVSADLNKDGTLTRDELVTCIRTMSPAYNGELDGIVVRPADSGEPVIFSSDMWQPVSEKSDDFISNILTDTPDMPTAHANGPYSGSVGSPLALNTGGSSSPHGGILLYEWDWQGDGVFDESTTSPVITHTWSAIFSGTVTLRVTDGQGFTELDSASVQVLDTTPPDITVSVTPTTLWPPNHKMVLVTPTITLSDNCDLTPKVKLTSITMNEGEQTNTYDPNHDTTVGSGNTTGDIQIDANGSIYLRAERSGTGSGRVYTITYTATDASGNSAKASATVAVPHNQ